MKTSFYNIYFQHNGKYYVYNTLTTSLVSLDETTQRNLKISKLENLPTEVIGNLIKQGLIVDDNMDELAVFECYYNESQYGGFRDELRVVLIPTYNCNLKCTYCFEECSSKKNMGENEIRQVLEFVKNQFSTTRNYKKISLILFGGEPLLCSKACITMSDALKLFASENDVYLSTMIITNAVLLNMGIINDLIIPTNMKVQITLDGSRRFHDERRIQKNGVGTYDRIIDSLNLLNKMGVRDNIDLRINVDKKNIGELEEVLKDVNEKVGYIYIGLLRAAGNNKERVSDCISDNEYIIYYRPQLAPLFKKYGKKLHFGGFGKKHSCAMNGGNSFIIDPHLNVYKCDNLVGKPEFAIGKISNGMLEKNAAYYIQRSWSPLHFERCRKCNRLPACTASCAYLCLVNNGSMNKPYCAVTESQLIGKITRYLDGLQNE